jgi:hypothetical protein
MEPLNSSSSCCRNCRHYQPEGRRGGHCHQLGVPVQGSWNACSLVCLAFTPSWKNLKEIITWQQGTPKASPKTLETQPVDRYNMINMIGK